MRPSIKMMRTMPHRKFPFLALVLSYSLAGHLVPLLNGQMKYSRVVWAILTLIAVPLAA